VLFKTRDALQNSLVQGNEHTIEGFQLECRQTMLREEMKNEEESEGSSQRRDHRSEREFRKKSRDFKDDSLHKDSGDYNSYGKRKKRHMDDDRYMYENSKHRDEKSKRYDRDHRSNGYRDYTYDKNSHYDSEIESPSRKNTNSKSGKSGKNSQSKVSEEEKITKEAVEFYKMIKMMMKQQGVQGEPLPNLLSMMAQQMQGGKPGYPG
jgi:hypothetical protein